MSDKFPDRIPGICPMCNNYTHFIKLGMHTGMEKYGLQEHVTKLVLYNCENPECNTSRTFNGILKHGENEEIIRKYLLSEFGNLVKIKKLRM